MDSPLPLASADLSQVDGILTDFDGTLTTANLLRMQTLRALWQLREAGVRVAFVSGRPAGWAECWVRTLPIDGVIAENGGLYFAWRAGAVHKVYAEREQPRRDGRRRLERAVAAELRRTPGARLSSDSAYTEVDLAIDYNEEARLPVDVARGIVARMRGSGFQAVRSSVHVNCWAGKFDKLKTSRAFCRREWKLDPVPPSRRVVYVGDSFNDAPLFGVFTLSIGVANVRPLLAELDAPPKFITRAEEGRGFEEVARAVLAQRRGRRRSA